MNDVYLDNIAFYGVATGPGHGFLCIESLVELATGHRRERD